MSYTPAPVSLTLSSLLSGEDTVNNRILTDAKPVDADAALTTLQNVVVTALNGTTVNLKGMKSLVVAITGTFTGVTANFEVTIDDSTWVAVGMVPIATPIGTYAVTATSTGMWTIPNMPAAYSQFRARTTISSPTGTMTVKARVHPR